MTARSLAVVALAAALFCGSLPAWASPTDSTAPAAATRPDTDHTIVVTFADAPRDPAKAAQQAVTDAAAAADIDNSQRLSAHTAAITLDQGLTREEVARVQAHLAASRAVVSAEPSIRFHIAAAIHPADWTAAPSDLWHIYAASGSRFGVQADRAWTTSTGVGVTVGVIDTGITAHPDLTDSRSAVVGGNVLPGYDFISDPTSAGDGDGADPDPTDLGDDYRDGRSHIPASWHGTHVAGIIAAMANGIGITGVAPGAKIVPLRALGKDGGSLPDVVRAIYWAIGEPVTDANGVRLPQNENPVGVLNLSLTSDTDQPCPTALQEAIDVATGRGVPVVVAAGNRSTGLSSAPPGNCRNVISVVASTRAGARAAYSNFGDARRPATIAAPGGSGCATACSDDILSTWNDGRYAVGAPVYAIMAGTSMAAPHVAAVVALLRSLHPTWPPAQITDVIRGSATPLQNCSVVECGPGVVNAAAAVATSGLLTQKVPARLRGRFRVGRTVAVKTGTWAPGPVSVRYQWLRATTPIAKATRSSYRLSKKDRRRDIRLQLVISGPAGFASTVIVLSGPTVR